MKAVEYERYGPPEVLEFRDVPKPSPKNNEILVRICATTVTATECIFRKGKPFFPRLFTGLLKPKLKRLGEELSGEIESAGKDVKSLRAGDRIFGSAGPEFGANAEYICLPEDGVFTAMPENFTYEQAAATCDCGLTALPFLRDVGKIRAGHKILVYGASGSIGSAAVQLASYFGADVTGVCSTANLDLVKSLGAHRAIDYTREDFTKNGETYDIIFDAVGKASFSRSKGSLKPDGVFLEAGIVPRILPQVLWSAMFGKKKIKIAATGLRPPAERVKDLVFLKGLMETGKLKPVIDKIYPFDRIVEAHRYVDRGHKRGNVVVTIGA